MRRIVLPQAMRVIIPPTGNEMISMLKTTSLVIAVPLTDRALRQEPGDLRLELFQPVPLLIVRRDLVPVDHLGADGRASTTWSGTSPAGVAAAAADAAAEAADAAVRLRPPPPAAGRAAAERPAWRRRRRGRAVTAATAADGAGRGGAQALRPARGAQGHRPDGRARRGDVRDRPVRLGQVDVPALHQPPGADQRRPALGRRRAGRLPAARRQAVRAARARGRPAAHATSAWSSSTSTCSRT